MVAGRVDIAIGSVGSTVQYIKDKRVQGLALSGKKRHPMFPEVPTFAEAGYPDYGVMYWFGVMAPAGVPDAILEKLQGGIVKATQSAELRKVFEGAGVAPEATGRREFTQRVAAETALWADVIKRANVKVD